MVLNHEYLFLASCFVGTKYLCIDPTLTPFLPACRPGQLSATAIRSKKRARATGRTVQVLRNTLKGLNGTLKDVWLNVAVLLLLPVAPAAPPPSTTLPFVRVRPSASVRQPNAHVDAVNVVVDVVRQCIVISEVANAQIRSDSLGR